MNRFCAQKNFQWDSLLSNFSSPFTAPCGASLHVQRYDLKSEFSLLFIIWQSWLTFIESFWFHMMIWVGKELLSPQHKKEIEEIRENAAKTALDIIRSAMPRKVVEMTKLLSVRLYQVTLTNEISLRQTNLKTDNRIDFSTNHPDEPNSF